MLAYYLIVRAMLAPLLGIGILSTNILFSPNLGIRNRPPKITTLSLPKGMLGTYYDAYIDAYDPDRNNLISMSIDNLPLNIFRGDCFDWTSPRGKEIRCLIGGTPVQSGLFKIKITVYDNIGAATTKYFPIEIQSISDS